MRFLSQVGSVTVASLRTLPRRVGGVLVVIVGIGIVVAVLVSVLAMGVGLRATLNQSGRADRALVLQQGANTEVTSTLDISEVRLILDSPHILHDVAGNAAISAETLAILHLHRKTTGAEVGVPLRGLGSNAPLVRPELALVDGRMFRSGVNELIVSERARSLYRDLDVGSRVRIDKIEWTVVGTFASGGGALESELLTDSGTMLALPRERYHSVTARLDSPASFTAFRKALTSNPMLAVDVVSEPEFFQQQSQVLDRLVRVVAYVVGSIMALGALLGSLNTMYGALNARRVEIATLRAIGFRPRVILSSMLIEALLLALAGAALGASLAWLLINGYVVSSSATGQGGQLAFELLVTPELALYGAALACVIGFLGALFPALRAARLTIATALRFE